MRYPLVEAMASTVDATAAICADLSAEQWALPTGCPGWSVRDVFAHLVGLEAAMLTGVEPDHIAPRFDYIRDDIGAYMENQVDFRRGVSPADLQKEYAEVFAERLALLRGLSPEEFEQPAAGPMGSMNPPSKGLPIRVFDLWAHEQDIRRALGEVGGLDTPAAEVAVSQCTKIAGRVVGAAMPNNATLVWTIDGPFGGTVAWSYADGRATALAEAPGQPTVGLAADTATFTTLCCGRSDARPEDVQITGDATLARAVLDHIGFTP